jgi:hypothetical protein
MVEDLRVKQTTVGHKKRGRQGGQAVRESKKAAWREEGWEQRAKAVRNCRF